MAANCNVCEESFNCASRKPLVLPCGHTYCLACLTAIETFDDRLCPACRESWDCAAYKLPISYMLIPGSNADVKPPKEAKSEYDICCLHSIPIEYWCCKCQVATCKWCISEQHYAHGNVVFESVFEAGPFLQDIKQNFPTKIGSKILAATKTSISFCEKGLKVMNSIKEAELTLQTWKKHLLAQEAHVSSCLQSFESKSESSMIAELELLAKLMSQCDAKQSVLSKQFKMASSKLALLEAEIKEANEQQKNEKLSILPQEIQPEASTLVMEGQSNVLRTLALLKNKTQEPTSVTVVSTCSSPIENLCELLIELCENNSCINLQLLDSFLHGKPSACDSQRIEPLIHSDYGKCLASFYGHICNSSTWIKLGTGKLNKLGLRLESGADLDEVNKILQENGNKFSVQGTNPEQQAERITDVCISKSVGANDIRARIYCNQFTDLRFHIVGLGDQEISWCSQVINKLSPPPGKNEYRSRHLCLHECTLSYRSFNQLLASVRTIPAMSHIYLQNEALTQASKQQFINAGSPYGLQLSFTIPKL